MACLATSRCGVPRSASPMTTSNPLGHLGLPTTRHDISTASNAADASYATDGREAARLDKTAAAHGPTRPKVTVLCERLSTLHDAGAGVERLLRTAADLHRRPPSSPPMRSGGASSGWRRGIDRRHRRRLGGESRRPRSRGKRSGYAKSVSRRRRTGCCIGLIDQARPWGVRRYRAQLRVAMSRPRGTPWRVSSIFIRFRSPELAGLPNSFASK